MNFRSTALLFGLFLGMLWLFGLMLAFKKTAVDENYVSPTLQAAGDFDIVKVTIMRQPGEAKKDGEGRKDEVIFAKGKDDKWLLQVPGIKSTARLDGFKVSELISQVKGARKSDEIGISEDLAGQGLKNPAIVVTLEGRNEKKEASKEWKFFVGNRSADLDYMYVNSSDRPDKVFGVARKDIARLFETDANVFRSQKLLNEKPVPPESVKNLELTQKPVGESQTSAELALKKTEEGNWRFVKPAYGIADYEGPPPAKTLVLPPKKSEGLKGLLSSILDLSVPSEADFVPLADATMSFYGLDDDKAMLRIHLTMGEEKGEGQQTLLVGFKVKGKDRYYARLTSDQAIGMVDAKALDPVFSALKDPGVLRSLDLLHVDTKKVDGVVLRQGKDLKDEIKVLHPDDKDWKLVTAPDKASKAYEKTIHDLLETLQGKGQIQKFYDPAESEARKTDNELGLSDPSAEVLLYVDGLKEDTKDKKDDAKDKEKKTDEKADEKKDDKKETKKDEKKEDKKDEAPKLRKDAKPAVTLTFGKTFKEGETEVVSVKRVLQDGTTSRVLVPRSIFDKAAPTEGALAFRDPKLPEFDVGHVDRAELLRGKEKIELTRGTGDKAGRWVYKDTKDTSGQTLGDGRHVGRILDDFGDLEAKKWLKPLDPKEDLEKYGLKDPPLTLRVIVKKEKPATAAALVGELASFSPASPAVYLAGRELDKGETIEIKLGKETDQDKDKPGVYALHSGSELLFLVQEFTAKNLRTVDFRDRSMNLLTQPIIDAALLAANSPPGPNAFLLTSPLVSAQIHAFEAAKVAALKLTIRTPYELRTLALARAAKDKSWTEQSGVQEFQPDAEKINKFLEDLGKLSTNRLVQFSGALKEEYKLADKDATLKVELTLEDNKSLTLTVGASFERAGYFATSSAWPGAVFFMPANKVAPVLSGLAYFGKERIALGP